MPERIIPDVWIGEKNAMHDYGLILQRCTLSVARKKQKLLNIPAMDGNLDLLAGFGDARYEARTLRMEFSTSGEPILTVGTLANDFEGKTVPIVLPGDPDRYMIGTVHVAAASRIGSGVVITASCQPWRYSARKTVHNIPAASAPGSYRWKNGGTMTVVPQLTVEGDEATVEIGGKTLLLPNGTTVVPALAIPGRGIITATVSGGPLRVEYREAIL